MSEEPITAAQNPSIGETPGDIPNGSISYMKDDPKYEMEDDGAGTAQARLGETDFSETQPSTPLASTAQSGMDGANSRSDIENAVKDDIRFETSDGASEAQPTGETTDSSPDQAAGEESDGAASSSEVKWEASTGRATSESVKSSLGSGREGIQPKSRSVSPTKAVVKGSSRSTPPPFVDDPNKISLRFIFANRDGLSVSADCKPADTIREVKGALLSMWPEELAACSGEDQIRLICMGRGILGPDSQTLKDCQVPLFKTHATPVNVSVRPVSAGKSADTAKKQSSSAGGRGSGMGGRGASNESSSVVSTSCACILL